MPASLIRGVDIPSGGLNQWATTSILISKNVSMCSSKSLNLKLNSPFTLHNWELRYAQGCGGGWIRTPYVSQSLLALCFLRWKSVVVSVASAFFLSLQEYSRTKKSLPFPLRWSMKVPSFHLAEQGLASGEGDRTFLLRPMIIFLSFVFLDINGE